VEGIAVSADPFNTVAFALEQRGKVRYFGADQLRAACPCCGGRSTHTLSAKRGDNGGVLVKCFKSECDIEAIARALGLEMADLFPQRMDGHASPKPRRIGLLPPMQALELIASEAWLIAVAGENLASGHALAEADLVRIRAASARIQNIVKEAHV
jgi:hypothetical protein